jgi:hypothetical protein
MLGLDRFRLRTRAVLLPAFGALLCVAMLAQGGGPSPSQTGNTPTTNGSEASDTKRDGSSAAVASEQLRTLHLLVLGSLALSCVNLLAVVGLYLRRIRVHHAQPTGIPLIEQFDDSGLRCEIAALRKDVERVSQQLMKLNDGRVADSDRELPQGTFLTDLPQREVVPHPAPPTQNGVAALVQEYQRSRSSRASWKDFEARHACERFECTNVRERLSKPEDQPRFETSTSGAYLAIPEGGKYFVFPFFSANPMQLYHDGAMSEVYEFPEPHGSAPLQVRQPAVFTRRDRQWFLQARGRLDG